MKVLFIGGTGNISHATSCLALEQGIELTLLNRGSRTQTVPGAEVICADCADIAAMSAAVADRLWDVVVNWVAFSTSDIQRDFELFGARARQYIFISSASAYQKPLTHIPITESTPLKNPFWEYSRNKINCEDLLNQLYREHDFPITIVRPSLTYDTVIPAAIGSWDDFTLIDRMRKGLPVLVHDTGESLWTVTHSRDFAAGLVGLLGNMQAIGHAFHITADEVLTWNQIYETMARCAGGSFNPHYVPSQFIGGLDTFQKGNLLGDKAANAVFDNSKIKRFVPGFQACIPFRQGFAETVRWFEKEPSRMKIVDGNNRFIDHTIELWQQRGQA